MAYPHILTYADAIEHAIGFIGGNPTAAGHAEVLRAIQDAYRELTDARRWTYLLKLDRIRVQAPYSTGTITYDHTGGSNELELTLASGTWPSWAAYGSVKIAGKIHRVATRVSNSVVTLDANRNPGADIAAGTSYTLFREVYSLPTDFSAIDMPFGEDRWRLGRYVRPNEWLSRELFGEGSGSPSSFTVMGDPDNTGRMAIHTLFVPTATDELDFLYVRRPRQLVFSGYLTAHKVGTVAIASNTTVTGTSTTFSSAMVGSLIRFSSSTTMPTGPDGTNPYAEQLEIATYSSATSLTTTSAASQTLTGVAYRVSDPVDISPSMHTAFRRCIEKHLAILKNFRNKDDISAQYERALKEAADLDGSAVYQPRQEGDGSTHAPRPASAVPYDSPR